MKGSVEVRRFAGAALQGNHLGDPSERDLIVYLPPSYGSGERRYPLLVVLTGYASTGASLLNFKPWEPSFLERYEKLLAAGCPEAVIAMPDCFTRYGGSQFIDSETTGRYQSYVADDVIAEVEKHYRVIAHRDARAIVGKSSGGFGALRMGLDRPEVFSVYGSHAGDCAFELSVRPRFVEVAAVYARAGGVEAFLARMAEQGVPRGSGEFHGMEMAAMASCYAPDPSGGAPFGELPFDPHTCMLRPNVWDRWLQHDPLERLRQQPQGLSQARLVFLDAGRWDEYGLQFGARMLSELLMNSGCPLRHEEFDGGHMGTGHRYEVSLPILLSALSSDSP